MASVSEVTSYHCLSFKVFYMKNKTISSFLNPTVLPAGKTDNFCDECSFYFEKNSNSRLTSLSLLHWTAEFQLVCLNKQVFGNVAFKKSERKNCCFFHTYLCKLLSRSCKIVYWPFLSLRRVNILSGCIVMSVVQLHAGLLCCLSPFIFVSSDAVSHSSTPPLKAVVLSPSITVCLMCGPSAGLFCFASDITALFWGVHLWIFCATVVLQLCCLRVILLLSLVLSLHYLLG